MNRIAQYAEEMNGSAWMASNVFQVGGDLMEFKIVMMVLMKLLKLMHVMEIGLL